MEADKIHLEGQLTQFLGGESLVGDASGGATPAGRRWGSGLLMRWRGSVTAAGAGDGGDGGGGGGGATDGGNGSMAGMSSMGGASMGGRGDGELPPSSPRDGEGGAGAGSAAAAPASPIPETAYGRLLGRMRARAVGGGAAEFEREATEAKRQVTALESENRHLVNALVQIKMELADVQGEFFLGAGWCYIAWVCVCEV
jgi:hypothetical protein